MMQHQRQEILRVRVVTPPVPIFRQLDMPGILNVDDPEDYKSLSTPASLTKPLNGGFPAFDRQYPGL